MKCDNDRCVDFDKKYYTNCRHGSYTIVSRCLQKKQEVKDEHTAIKKAKSLLVQGV